MLLGNRTSKFQETQCTTAVKYVLKAILKKAYENEDGKKVQ